MENFDEDIIINAELIITKNELHNILNKGIKICCPKCHSENYGIYPTGQRGLTITTPEEDIHYICKKCRWVWNSEFRGDRYKYKKSNIEGYDYLTKCI